MSAKSPKQLASSWPFFALGLVLLALFLFGSKLLLSIPEPLAAEDAARSAERTKAYQDLQADNLAKLTTYAWADAQKGAVQIPISEAMKIAAARLSAQSPAPAGPINPPPSPAPEAATAPAPTPETAPAPADSTLAPAP
jgi:hypothetical protein